MVLHFSTRNFKSIKVKDFSIQKGKDQKGHPDYKVFETWVILRVNHHCENKIVILVRVMVSLIYLITCLQIYFKSLKLILLIASSCYLTNYFDIFYQ